MKKGITDTRTHTIFYSGKDSGARELGVAFIIKKSIKGLVMDFQAISERICILRIRGRFSNISLVNLHAETKDKDERTKDAFYQQLERVFDNLPLSDVKIVLGDMNAKIDTESVHRLTIGAYSLHTESNDNGRRIVDFAQSKDLVISSTYFQHSNIHKWTWTSPSGLHHNQTDQQKIRNEHPGCEDL